MIQSRGGKGGRGGVVGSRRERNTALTQTMRSLERSFQGLRKAYNPVYRPRKSGDIYSAARSSSNLSPLLLSSSRKTALLFTIHLSRVGKLGWCFNPFPILRASFTSALQDRSAPICRFRKRAGCLPAVPHHVPTGCPGN